MKTLAARAAAALFGALVALAAGAASAQPPTCRYKVVDAPKALFPGIGYQTIQVACTNTDGAHQALAHVLTLDVGAGAIQLAASAPGSSGFVMQLPSDVLVATGASVAVNANLFSNCCVYAAPGLPTQLAGWEASGGQTYALQGADPAKQGFPFDASLVQLADRSVTIVYSAPGQPVPVGAVTAVTGSHMLVFGGKSVAPPGDPKSEFFGPNARTAAGLSADAKTLWLVAFDRSPSPNTGLELAEAAQALLHLGANTALNLDGGGSTSMVQATTGGAGFALLNTPADYQPPCTVYASGPTSGCERYVGTTLTATVQASGR
ncbi:hypothetical protein ASD21_07910 [Caulobacter sp. Root1455]|uniref:phosphodiester glycosidase family protein n=1 Tax=Caulobacter sp. Root1455 TaxID=1736465 RepID=UPI0006F35802|nr:phosphodiester glycosidase family protein [Caulobacter sp. Root1455]KQY95280.1 hypothetical protein ASD21_07910 [Caulobacter sp. Root1455]